jgi:hypothetical protein
MVERMRFSFGSSGLRVLAGVLLAGMVGAARGPAQQAARDAVTLTPAVVAAGSPELVHVMAPAGARLSGDWLGHPLAFFPARDGHGWFALAGVDVAANPGPSTLHISEKLRAGDATRDLIRTIDIQPGHYRTGVLRVPPRFVVPPLSAIPEIKAEIALKKTVFSASAPEPLWSGDFRAPVRAAPTDSFGTRRTFNGELASIHKGMDFRAHAGTPVRASNDGVVVLARKLYYEGNCVAIDHGLGLYTIAMHLSHIDVHQGEHVRKGQLLGLSGATGRVTGPHLHWAGALGGYLSGPGQAATDGSDCGTLAGDFPCFLLPACGKVRIQVSPVKKIPVFLLLCAAVAFCPAQDLASSIQAMKSAYAASGNMTAIDSQTILIEPRMPAPLCAVPKDADGQTTWRYYSFPLSSITLPLADVDEKLIGEDEVFTSPDAAKTYKPGQAGDTTLVIIAGIPGKEFHTLLYDRDKFIQLGPGPHASREYSQRPDDTEAFALAFSDRAAAQSFAAALKKAVLLARAQAAMTGGSKPLASGH